MGSRLGPMNRRPPPSPTGATDSEQEELQVALRRLLRVTGASLEQRAHLERALESRIEIEQAKGILSERLRVSLNRAFELLRQTARAERRSVHGLAREVIERPDTPHGILVRLQALLEVGGSTVADPHER